MRVIIQTAKICLKNQMKHMPELESEESAAKRNIASRAKLRRKILNTIKEKKNNNNELFSHYFNYSSPSNMLSKLSYASDEGNKN